MDKSFWNNFFQERKMNGEKKTFYIESVVLDECPERKHAHRDRHKKIEKKRLARNE